MSIRTMQASKEEIKSLEEKSDALEKELTRLVSSFKKTNDGGNVDYTQIQQALQPDEAAIEFANFKKYDGAGLTDSSFYTALVLRKDRNEPELVPIFEQRRLTAILQGANAGV